MLTPWYKDEQTLIKNIADFLPLFTLLKNSLHINANRRTAWDLYAKFNPLPNVIHTSLLIWDDNNNMITEYSDKDVIKGIVFKNGSVDIGRANGYQFLKTAVCQFNVLSDKHSISFDEYPNGSVHITITPI